MMRSELQTFLKTLHDRVWFQVAPEKATFPYITYDFSSASDSGEYEELYLIDISAWDYPDDGDSNDVEDLIQLINAGLDKKIIEVEDKIFVFYLNSKVYVPTDDKRLKRRLYTYEAKIYKTR